MITDIRKFKGNIIYKPSGLAAEYAPLAANFYKSCPHGCVYCYAPGVLRIPKNQYFSKIRNERKNILTGIEKDCRKLKKVGIVNRTVQMSFIGDPLGYGSDLPVSVIKIFEDFNIPFSVLTKSEHTGHVINQMSGYEKCSFGISLVWGNSNDALKYEPGAASVESRIDSLKDAHDAGVKTWVSIEPVINAENALTAIEMVCNAKAGFIWIGKINHNKELEEKTDWQIFTDDAKKLINKLGYGKKYAFKTSLT